MTMTNQQWKDWIPLYLNGRLTPDRRGEFEARLEEDGDLAREFQDFSRIKKSYSRLSEQLGPPSPEVFDRIMDYVEASGRVKEAGQCDAPGFDPVSAWRRWMESFRLAWAVSAVQFAVILILVFTQAPDPGFRTLGASGEPDPRDIGFRINVVFDPGATEGEIRELLTARGLAIVDGPTDAGLYVLKADGREEAGTVIHYLKESRRVRFAEKRL